MRVKKLHLKKSQVKEVEMKEIKEKVGNLQNKRFDPYYLLAFVSF
jgi:hypothetical protein